MKNINKTLKNILDFTFFKSLAAIFFYFVVLKILSKIINTQLFSLELIKRNKTIDDYNLFLENNPLVKQISDLPSVYKDSFLRSSSLDQLLVYLILFILVFLIFFTEIKKDSKEFFTKKVYENDSIKENTEIPDSNFEYADNKKVKTNNEPINLSQLSNKTSKYYKIVTYTIFAYLVNIVGSLISFLIKYIVENGNITEITSRNQDGLNLLLQSNTTNALLIIPSICILGPIVEELIFRKSIFNIFKAKYVSIVISAVLFGFMHTIDSNYTNLSLLIANTIPYLFLGLYLAYIYSKENKNIIYPILIHMILNTISILFII